MQERLKNEGIQMEAISEATWFPFTGVYPFAHITFTLSIVPTYTGKGKNIR